jgi:ribosomal RNA-processing protein 17
MENEYGLPFVRPRPKKSVLPPSKKRKTNSAVEEINFDFDSRAEYLTGFHKRKVQRATRAKEEAAKKEREERVLMRKQVRQVPPPRRSGIGGSGCLALEWH